MKIGCIVQARMGSTRLRGKMSLPFFEGKGIFECLLTRLARVFPENLVVATTTESDDQQIVDIANNYGIACYRGSTTDVQSRFVEASKLYNFNSIIRVCADNPFIDVAGLSELVRNLNCEPCDYVSWFTRDGTPAIRTHYGFWAEGFTAEALQKARTLSQSKPSLEHVTPAFYENNDVFRITKLPMPEVVESIHDLRLTIDTIEDFDIAKCIYADVANKQNFELLDVLSAIEQHPEAKAIMRAQITNNQK